MIEIIETPRMYSKLTRFNGSERKLILDYFYYELTVEDLIEMILNRAADMDIVELLRALQDGD